MPAAPLCRNAGLLSLLSIIAAPSAVDCIKLGSIVKDDEFDEVQLVQWRADGFSEENVVERKLNTTGLQRKREPIGGTMPSWIAPCFERKLNATETFLLSLDPVVAHHATRMLGFFSS